MDIGGAASAMSEGKRVARAGWNGKGMWLRRVDLYCDKEFSLRETEPCFGTFAPFVVVKTPDNKLVPWNCSQADLLATDWEIVP